jgi:SWI/SNF-related matrix-associated actin-dependent regulator of chromatin subfamily D
MDPIEILYEVRVDTAKHLSKTAWDVEVEHEDLAKSRPGLVALGGQAGIATQKEITSMDNRIGDICRELDNSRLKRNFMLAFAEDPAGFTNRWVESQSEDLKLMLGDGKFNPEEIRRAGFFEKPEIEEAVYHYLNGRMAGTVGSHRVPEKK